MRILRALRRTLSYNNGIMLQHKKGLTFEVIFNEIKFWNSIHCPLFIILCTMLSAGDLFLDSWLISAPLYVQNLALLKYNFVSFMLLYVQNC